MKRIWKLILCGMLAPAFCAIAQDSMPRTEAGALTPTPTLTATPTPTATATPSRSIGPTPTPIPQSALSLIPSPSSTPAGGNATLPSVPAMPDLSKLDQIFKTTTPGKEVELYRAHVEWRQLKNRTVNDPDVVAAKASAESATTDLDKRNRLRAYYEIFYGHMRALATTPEIIAYLDSMKTAHLDLLAQPRVRPTPDTGKKPAATPAPLSLPTPEQATPVVPEPALPNK